MSDINTPVPAPATPVPAPPAVIVVPEAKRKPFTHRTCSECSGMKRKENIIFDIKRKRYCRSCGRRKYDGIFHGYCHTTARKFYYAKGERKKFGIPLGVEMEFDRVGRDKGGSHVGCVLSAAQMPFTPDVKGDGSLSGEGFEMAYQPATLNAWREVSTEVYAFFKYLKVSGWDGRNKGGMHVHVGLDKLTNKTLAQMFMFVYDPQNKKLVVDISSRRSENLNCWASIGYISADNIRRIERTKQNCGMSRSTALNITSRTVEFRIFNSTTTPRVFFKNLEFVSALIKFCTVMTTENIKKDVFLHFVSESWKMYPNLYNFLVRKGHIKPTPEAKLATETEKDDKEDAGIEWEE